jgi:hypothetical protein
MPKNKNIARRLRRRRHRQQCLRLPAVPRILGGEVVATGDGFCTVTRERPELSPTILGRPYTATAMFGYRPPTSAA